MLKVDSMNQNNGMFSLPYQGKKKNYNSGIFNREALLSNIKHDAAR